MVQHVGVVQPEFRGLAVLGDLVLRLAVLVGGDQAQLVQGLDGDAVVLVQHQHHLVIGLGPGAVEHVVAVGVTTWLTKLPSAPPP